MSGVGKSTALAELARRGYATVDTDEGPWVEVVEVDPLLRQVATHEIDTTAPISDVVDTLAGIAEA